jgi:uncharacterized protein (TIGR03435 family)
MTAQSREDFLRLRNTGGPGTNDPGRIHYPLISLKALLGRAFDSYHDIQGPSWLDTDIVAVDATMPPDTTKEQFREMLANLIKDRFGLEYHVETREVAAYSLVVAKSGPKIKESAEPPAEPPAEQARNEAAQPAPQPRQMGPDGFPVPPKGAKSGILMAGQGARIFGRRQGTDQLARDLSGVLHCPVADATGLKAKYDYAVTYSPEAADFPDLFSALPSQLGLRLEPGKAPVEIMVIDHMEKSPVAN